MIAVTKALQRPPGQQRLRSPATGRRTGFRLEQYATESPTTPAPYRWELGQAARLRYNHPVATASTNLPGPQAWEHVPGRPTGLTPALADGIRSLILAGASTRRAALTLGVPPTTFERWRERARRRRRPYADCFETFEIAEAVFLGGAEQALAAATRDDWRAAAWLLSRRLPGDYGDAKQITRAPDHIPAESWAALVERHGGNPKEADFAADMKLLIEAKQKAADKAEFDRLPHDQQRALIEAELERRGLPTKIYKDDF